MNKQLLILEQIDRKIIMLKKLKYFSIPDSGWVYAIRQALGMSLRQLGKKMGITPQSVKEIEEREKNGTVSLNVLKEFGNSIDLKLVYGFIPKDKSLKAIIEKRAMELATEIVSRTSINMKLEDQENNPKRLKNAISLKSEEIKMEMPNYLWD